MLKKTASFGEKTIALPTPKKLKNDRILRSYRELADYLNIGQESARKLMLRDDFPCITISPHVRIVPINALEDWLRKQ
jgi:hypothetical protein